MFSLSKKKTYEVLKQKTARIHSRVTEHFISWLACFPTGSANICYNSFFSIQTYPSSFLHIFFKFRWRTWPVIYWTNVWTIYSHTRCFLGTVKNCSICFFSVFTLVNTSTSKNLPILGVPIGLKISLFICLCMVVSMAQS